MENTVENVWPGMTTNCCICGRTIPSYITRYHNKDYSKHICTPHSTFYYKDDYEGCVDTQIGCFVGVDFEQAIEVRGERRFLIGYYYEGELFIQYSDG